MTIRAHILADDGEILNTIMVEELSASLVDADLVGGNIGDSVDRSADPWVVIPRPVPPITPEEHNAPILAALADIDARSIRPLRAGETAMLAQLEAEAVALRAQLISV